MTGVVELRHKQGAFVLDASFAFGDAPCVTALFGSSGAGKSTIIHAIAGLLRPDRGRIVVGDDTLFDSERGIFLSARERRIGVVFQDLRLFPHLSVQANLLYGWRRSGQQSACKNFDDVVNLLGLESLLERRPRTLSGGERSRVALGRALLMNPRALLLDEPLAALDAPRKAEILPYLERLVRETRIPMLYVSHALDEVARLADRMVVLERGRVVAEGSMFDLTARLDLFTGKHPIPGTVLEASISRHDAAHGLTELAFGSETLVVPAISRAAGEKVRIRIDADDVMLALERPNAVSANNVLAAMVADIRADGTNADVQLSLGGAHMIARITSRSVERLGLRPGTPVFALIKSVTVGGREQA